MLGSPGLAVHWLSVTRAKLKGRWEISGPFLPALPNRRCHQTEASAPRFRTFQAGPKDPAELPLAGWKMRQTD
jgi:hypothetical protein